MQTYKCNQHIRYMQTISHTSYEHIKTHAHQSIYTHCDLYAITTQYTYTMYETSLYMHHTCAPHTGTLAT